MAGYSKSFKLFPLFLYRIVAWERCITLKRKRLELAFVYHVELVKNGNCRKYTLSGFHFISSFFCHVLRLPPIERGIMINAYRASLSTLFVLGVGESTHWPEKCVFRPVVDKKSEIKGRKNAIIQKQP